MDSRTPVLEDGQQEDFEQYFRNTLLWTSATGTLQDHLSYDDSADARRASDSRPRKKCNVLFKEYPYRPTSIQTRSHRPRMRTSLLVLLAHL